MSSVPPEPWPVVARALQRRVLVTGASGFVGRNLCARLLSLGSDVYATRRSPSGPLDGASQWFHADLADLSTVRTLFETTRPEIVFHLAASVTGERQLDLVPETLASTLISTVNVLIAAKESGCQRVLLAGSMEEPTGSAPAVPSSPYAAAKWAAGGYARMFRELYGLSAVTLRIFMVYGPGQSDVRKLIPYTTLSLLHGEQPLLASGTRAVDWIYIDDVVDAFVLAAAARGEPRGTLEIGSGTSSTIREVVERLALLINPNLEASFGALEDRALETCTVADPLQAEAAIGWRPTTSLDQGLRRTVEWYAQQEGIAIPSTPPRGEC